MAKRPGVTSDAFQVLMLDPESEESGEFSVESEESSDSELESFCCFEMKFKS